MPDTQAKSGCILRSCGRTGADMGESNLMHKLGHLWNVNTFSTVLLAQLNFRSVPKFLGKWLAKLSL